MCPPAMLTNGHRTAYRTCPLCEATCGLELELDAKDRVLSIRGDKADVFSRGFICPRAPRSRRCMRIPIGYPRR